MVAGSLPARRVLRMLFLVEQRPGIGGRAIAEELGVNLRTVRRYATSLRAVGVPLESERGAEGGYRIQHDATAPSPRGVWWADRLAPTVIVEQRGDRVLFGNADAPFGFSPDEALEIAATLRAAAVRARVVLELARG